jgi:cyclopropane-fatty-acyl-phospholipid synthase
MFKRFMVPLLARADIEIQGSRLSDVRAYDPVVRDERLYRRVALFGSLGLGEAYQDGWWDADLDGLPEFFRRIMSSGADRAVRFNIASTLLGATARIVNMQSALRAFMVGEQHYDLGNDLFDSMLDPTMNYSCAYWQEPVTGAPIETLEGAQRAKMKLCALKLKLEPGMKVLEIGCGWGGLAEYLAREHGVEVVGLTVSKEQAAFARERCEGLPVQILMKDYRDLPARYDGYFDRIVSVGMFEHVGPKNYRTYMSIAHRVLKPNGLFLLHSIGGDGRQPEPWHHRYIFPNGVLPAADQIARAFQDILILEDWHNFGPFYAKTLAAWRKNFVEAWPRLSSRDPARYDRRFFRTWIYYLTSCEGAFLARRMNLWQIALRKAPANGAYQAVR